MMRERIAVGQWYLREDTQERFQVLDYGERAGTILIQMFDGSLDEIDEDAWLALCPEPVDPPEDWTGPLDNVEVEELEEFENEAAAGVEDDFINDRRPWDSLWVEEDEEGQEPEEPEDGWMTGVLVARAHSRTRMLPRSRA